MRLRHLAFLALAPLLGCAEGTSPLEYTTGAGGSLSGSSHASSSSSSSTGVGGAGAAGGAGGAGGSGGIGGMGGMGGSGGAGGGGGMGATVGSGGAGGSSSSASGSGGAGGMGGMGGGGGMGGMGGAGGGGGGPTGTLLVLAGPSAGEAHFESGVGWSTGSINLQFSASGLALLSGGGAMALLRRQSANQAENNELFWATWMKGAGFGAVQTVGNFGFAQDGPATAPLGVATLMTFLGTDNKHYYAQNDTGAAFGPFGQIPGGMAGTQAFGPSATTLAGDGAAGAYAIYAGDDSHLYYAYKPGPGSAWGTSTQIPTQSLVINTIRPAAIVETGAYVRVFYVRQSDNRICMVEQTLPQGSWSAEETVGSAATNRIPAIAATSGGDFVVAYHGALNEGIYFVRGKKGAWGTAQAVEVPATPSTAPVALSGLSGADAEIVYATGGSLKHARVNGMAVTANAVPGVANVVNLSATIVP